MGCDIVLSGIVYEVLSPKYS